MTSIDNVVCNTLAYRDVADMNRDENKEILHWSDHNLITVRTGKVKREGRPQKVRAKVVLRKKAAEDISWKLGYVFGTRGPNAYGDLVENMRTAITDNTKLNRHQSNTVETSTRTQTSPEESQTNQKR